VTSGQRICLLLVLIVTCVLPAFANNPPQPDGVFSVLLIFPAVLIGMRLAAVLPDPKTTTRRLVIGLVLGFCFILTLAGTEIGLIGLLAILVYGIVRGIEIMRRGQGWKSRLIGTIVLLWVVFAVGNYYASIVSAHPSVGLDEALAVQRLRILSTAEGSFANGGSPSEPVYGTVADLVERRLIESSLRSGQVKMGYRLGEIVKAPKRQYLFYAVPVQIQSSGRAGCGYCREHRCSRLYAGTKRSNSLECGASESMKQVSFATPPAPEKDRSPATNSCAGKNCSEF
jgi:hypothetical protein